MRPASASVRVVVPPEVKPTAEVYALVDNLLVRAGATPRRVGVIDTSGVAAVDARDVGDVDAEGRDVPWRRVPAIGARPLGTAALPLTPLRAEPVTFVHTKPAPVTRELPPLKSPPSAVVVGFATPSRSPRSSSSPRTPEPVVGTIPDEPIDRGLPPELLPPGVGAIPGGGEPAAVPEPAGVTFAAALFAMTISRRRR
jgi:hypothetical protein